MSQETFDFTARDLPPINGRTLQSRHSSYTGAVHALKSRGEKVEALRQLLANHGPLTLNECASILRYPLSSICSLKAALPVRPDGFDVQDWGDGKTTKRTKWRLA